MSNQINTNLLEKASEHIQYWSNTTMGRVLEADLERDDLESLSAHIKESERLIYEAEYQRDDPLTDERAEAIYEDIY